MELSILEVITLFLLLVSVLLATFVLTVKTANKRANIFLGVYFLIFAIHISVFFYAKHITLPPVLEMLRDHIAFFTSPLLFLYVVSSIYSDFQLKAKHVLHVLPFVIQVLIFSPRFYFADNDTRDFLMEHLNDSLEGKLSIVFGLLIALFYLTIMFVEIKKYKQILLENYSNKSSFNYKWLHQLLVLLTVIFCFSLLKQLYKLFGTDVEVLNILRLVLTLTLIGFLMYIVLKSLYHPELFRNIDSDHFLGKRTAKGKFRNSVITEGSHKELQKLLTFMEDEEPYIDASLSLQTLAEKLETTHRELSQLINLNLQQHFFDFINQYRIKKAERILLDPTKENLTIQQIMYDVGFNSKSSFYTAFKKQTGVTPKEYRKRKSIE